MINAEFIEVYSPDLTDRQIHQGVKIPEVRAAQRYSYEYGRLLYGVLAGDQQQVAEIIPIVADQERTQPDFNLQERTLIDTPGGWERRGEINFRFMNEHMGPLWAPLIGAKWRPDERNREMHLTMNSLAMAGLEYFSIREQFVKIHGTEALFTPTNYEFNKRVTGVLQEVDIAILLLEYFRKHPNIAVIPAPMQFERANPQTNVDFLVIDTDQGKTVGVQAKTSVRQHTVDRYDPDRVVLVDGTVDLGNVRVMRTDRKKSATSPQPWPGIVAASRVDAIQTYGKNLQIPQFFLPRIQRAKFEARAQVGKLRVDTRELCVSIGERVLAKL